MGFLFLHGVFDANIRSEATQIAAGFPPPAAEDGTQDPRFRFEPSQALEAESIHILREAAAEFAQPVMLYSIGKDSSVLLRLAQKAFSPGKSPFLFCHRHQLQISRNDRVSRLLYEANQCRLDCSSKPGCVGYRISIPSLSGTQKCCGLLKTRALLDAFEACGFDAAFGGARRDEEKSGQERIYSFRDLLGQ